MKNKYNITKKVASGATEILLTIVDLLEHAFEEAILDHYHRGWPKDFEKRSNPTIRSALSRMKQQGWIVSEKKRNKVYYTITHTGRLRILLKNVFKIKKRPHDRLSTVIIFDIPETKRKARYFLRRLLLKNGFINLQKSVMIGPFELPSEFFELLLELKIREHVTMMKSKIIY